MPEIVNLQKGIAVDTRSLTSFCKTLGESVTETAGKNFTVAFISDDRMTQLNSVFRSKEATTDVLSFPNEPDQFSDNTSLGDIVISAEQAQRQAVENKLSFENEIRQLILHGLLHLCGYDHETDHGEMERRELELRSQLAI